MKGFIEEFKKFAIRGNVVDLAVGVVIGTAFGKIVSSLVTNIIGPILGILMGGINLNALSFKLANAEITYGVFLQSIIDFVIVAFAIFIAIKIMNRLQKKEDDKPEEKKDVEPTEEIKLLRQIRDSLHHVH